MWRRRAAVHPSHLLADEFAPSVGGPRRRTGVALSGQSSAALGTEDEQIRPLAIASAILLFCTPQSSELAALAGTERVAEGALQVDGEELMAGRRSPCGQGPRRQDAVANSPPARPT